MPHWLLLALIPPFLFALVNHIDKYLIEKYFKRGEVGSLILFSSLVGIPVATVIGIFHPSVFSIPFSHAGLLILGGALFILGSIAYFYALEADETSFVAPLFQMIPVISFFLAFIFLKETLSLKQIIGSFIIFAGVTALSVEFSAKGFILKKKTFLLMFFASVFMSVDNLIFKIVTVEADFWQSAFWEYIGFIVIAMIIFVFFPAYRKHFLKVVKQNSVKVLSLNFSNEGLVTIGKIMLHYASLLGPLSLVTLVSEGLQPFFVLAIGVILTLFWPQIVSENLAKKYFLHKLVAIFCIFLGTYFISS